MCDYSLTNVRSRPARVGDKLTVRDFGTGTRGFCAPCAKANRPRCCSCRRGGRQAKKRRIRNESTTSADRRNERAQGRAVPIGIFAHLERV